MTLRMSEAQTRAPPFLANEYVRLFHVLLDGSMNSARRLLTGPRDRDDLDREHIYPWEDMICDLFCDPEFKPEPCKDFFNGITRTDVLGLDPTRYTENARNRKSLSKKCAQFRSGYSKVVEDFEKSGQNDSICFHSSHFKVALKHLPRL